jgi:hypothetical protein
MLSELAGFFIEMLVDLPEALFGGDAVDARAVPARTRPAPLPVHAYPARRQPQLIPSRLS